MMKKYILILLCLFIVVVIGVIALAANPGDGSWNSQGPAHASPTAIEHVNENSVLAPTGFGDLRVSVLDYATKAPISDATVSVNSISAITDNNGNVVFLELPAKKHIIEASALGYVKNFETVKVISGAAITSVVFLKQIAFQTVINPSISNSIIADHDSDGVAEVEISFPAGAFPTTDLVTVSITGGDPTDTSERDLFPGNFFANEDRNPVMLESVYFAEISANANGNELTTLTSPADVCFKVPSALNSSYEVRDKIPVYFFDPVRGTWVMEGQSTVVQNSYGKRACFTITHLSWWNVDKPIETHTTIYGSILDPDGNPLANTYVSADGVSYNSGSAGVTDQNGEFCIDVKRGGETVKIRVGYYHYYGTVAPSADPQMPTSNESFATIVTTPDNQATCPAKVKNIGTLKFPKLDVREVGFTDDHGDKFIANPSTIALAITDPVWVRNAAGIVTKNVPVVYKRGIQFKLKDTKFKSDLDITKPLTVTVKGDGNESYDYETKGLISGEWLELNNTAAQSSPDKVALFEPYAIKWKYTYDGWTEYDAGTSEHLVYVTLRKPNPLQISPPAWNDFLILDIVDNAVRPAVDAQHPDVVLEKIFNRISNLSVAGTPAAGAITQKILNPVTGELTDGNALTYYVPGGARLDCPSPSNPPTMLFGSGNGRCGDWAFFLGEMLAVHGISSELIGFIVHEAQVTSAPTTTACTLNDRYIFLVKDWGFTDPGTSGDAEFPYERDTTSKTEFVDNSGIPGQSDSNPPGFFWDHAIIRYSGKYYDPSYGVGPYATLHPDYENAAIDGYSKLPLFGALDAALIEIRNGFGKKNDLGKQEICIDYSETFPGSVPELPETIPPPPPSYNASIICPVEFEEGEVFIPILCPVEREDGVLVIPEETFPSEPDCFLMCPPGEEICSLIYLDKPLQILVIPRAQCPA